MKGYTTPLETFIVDVDIANGCDVFVYLRNKNHSVEKSGNQLSLSVDDLGQTKIEFSLTQEETAELANGTILAEVTWKNRASGYVGKTETAYINGKEALRKGVI